MKTSGFIFSLLLLIGTSSVFAGGFQINEQNARAMAMGGAFTAIVSDPSAVYYNNAALTRLSGFQVQVGTTAITAATSFRGPYGPGISNGSIAESNMNKKIFFPSHAYFTYQATDQIFLGLGFNTPFGLGSSWDKNWVGRKVSVDIDLKTFSFNPTVAYKLSKNFSIGAGFQYNLGSVMIEKSADVALLDEATVHLEGTNSKATGYTIGALATSSDGKKLSVGLNYRSEVKYEFKGTATSTIRSGLASALALLPHGDITAVLKSPAQLVLGVSYMLTDDLTLSADYQYIYWSSYDTLKVTFDDGKQNPIASARLYQDTYIGRFGLEYRMNSDLALRCGILYDKNPVTDALVDASLPDANRVGYSAGFGYKISESLNVDLGYLFLRFKERTITNSKVSMGTGSYFMNGTYNTAANLMSFTLSYKF